MDSSIDPAELRTYIWKQICFHHASEGGFECRAWASSTDERGGAIAVLLYYLVGTLIFIFHLWGRSSVLHPSYAPPRFDWEPIREILRVGGLSAIVSSTTIGYAMYCVGQGAGGMKWPVAGACVRTAVAVLGDLGWGGGSALDISGRRYRHGEFRQPRFAGADPAKRIQ
jgi:hypothetical protein